MPFVDRRQAKAPPRRPPVPVLLADARRRAEPAAGFTLLELIVVIMLLTILLGFAIPAFKADHTGGSRDLITRELLQAVKKLKIAALRRQTVHALHMNLDQNRIWVTRAEEVAADDDTAPQPQWERTLPEGIRIEHVRFPDNREVRSGSVVIAFYPQGYSDRAVIRLSDDTDTTTDLVVEAFLPMALIAEED